MARVLASFNVCIMAVSALALVSCQSSGSGNTATQQSATVSSTTEETVASQDTNAESSELALVSADGSTQPAGSAISCHFQLAGGPPPKPARGADFGKAVGKNVGKSVQRGILQQIGGRVAGGLGSAMAGGVANSTIRNEEDIKGVWKITDGVSGCGCEISVDSAFQLQGGGKDNGQSATLGCQNPQLKSVATWALGHSFTGYDAKFELKAKDRRTVMATLNRDGIHYFSGALSNGTPVTMWRDGQTYNQLASFKKKVK